jgi:hypothetical protein
VGAENGLFPFASGTTIQGQLQYLGLIVDAGITWKPHIEKVKSKIARFIPILAKSRRVHDTTTLKLIYNSFLYPHLVYGIELWGHADCKHLDLLIKCQKKMVQIISGAGYQDHTAEIFINLGILNIRTVFLYRL